MAAGMVKNGNDLTGRIKTAVRVETIPLLEEAERGVKRIKFWLGVVVAVATAGFVVSNWLHSLAKETDLKTLNQIAETQDRRIDAVEIHYQDVNKRLDGVDDSLKSIRSGVDHLLEASNRRR